MKKLSDLFLKNGLRLSLGEKNIVYNYFLKKKIYGYDPKSEMILAIYSDIIKTLQCEHLKIADDSLTNIQCDMII